MTMIDEIYNEMTVILTEWFDRVHDVEELREIYFELRKMADQQFDDTLERMIKKINESPKDCAE